MMWLLLTVFGLPAVFGHLCLIIPRQRGDMDISKGGSPTCFRHGAECGGIPGQYPPPVEVQGGKPIFIKWQQNFNHYSVGYTGYMDIGFSVANRETGTETFTILAEVPDVYEHDQDHQRNYTAVVTLPNKDCDHCVIRARYNAHKPGETTFYQCADIRVRKTSTSNLITHQSSVQLLDQELKLNISPHTNKETLSVTRTQPMRFQQIDFAKKPVNTEANKGSPVYRTPMLPNKSDQPSANAFSESVEISKTDQSIMRLRRALQLIDESSTARLFEKRLPPTGRLTNSVTNLGSLLTGSDVIASTTPPVSSPAPQILAMGNNMESVGGLYYSVDSATGERNLKSFLDFRVDSPKFSSPNFGVNNATKDYVTAGVFTFDPARGVSVLPMNAYGNMDAKANRFIEIQSSSGRTTSVYEAHYNNQTYVQSPFPFSAIRVEIEGSFVTFSIVPASESGKFDFVIGRLHAGGQWVQLSKTDQGEDTYINFMWAEYDIAIKSLHVLLGNENDPYNLTARLYTFFVPPWDHPIGPVPPPYSHVDLDVSLFTFTSFHLDPLATNKLYAVSPGRHGTQYPAYYLVSANIDTGSVTPIMQIAPEGIFASYYGGAVFNGLNSLTNQLLHVLKVGDTNADVIATIDILKRTVTFSQPTSISNLYNLACAWNLE